MPSKLPAFSCPVTYELLPADLRARAYPTDVFECFFHPLAALELATTQNTSTLCTSWNNRKFDHGGVLIFLHKWRLGPLYQGRAVRSSLVVHIALRAPQSDARCTLPPVSIPRGVQNRRIIHRSGEFMLLIRNAGVPQIPCLGTLQ